MCYSAMVEHDLRVLRRRFAAEVDFAAYERLYAARLQDSKIKIPKAMDANFIDPKSNIEKAVASQIAEYRVQQGRKLEAEMFKQKTRLAGAERKLAVGTTAAAEEDKRISTDKIEGCRNKLANLLRSDLKPADSRIFPQMYATVIVSEGGHNVIRPMRYLLRRAGKPATDDKNFSGGYNSRKDNLAAFWKGQFSQTHALIQISSFYENVSRHRFEKRELAEAEREQNLVLHFMPRPPAPMTVACLWSHWEGEGHPGLDSFAAITDEPPPEVSAAGHDRCVIQLREENFGAWLNPSGMSHQELFSILDDRQLPFYQHSLAA